MTFLNNIEKERNLGRSEFWLDPVFFCTVWSGSGAEELFKSLAIEYGIWHKNIIQFLDKKNIWPNTDPNCGRIRIHLRPDAQLYGGFADRNLKASIIFKQYLFCLN